MDIRDFVDLKELEEIQEAWSNATGLASVFTDAKGEYITGDYNFTDFCIKLTRGSEEGLRRCIDTDQNGLKHACLEKGCYKCHAGLMDFAYPIRIEETGEVVMTAIGGQVLPSDGDWSEDGFRAIAEQIGVNPDEYVEALKKVPLMPEAKIRACADMLGMLIEIFVNMKYQSYHEAAKMKTYNESIVKINDVIERCERNSKMLTSIASKEGILALNTTIEAARLGSSGATFNILAKQQNELSKKSGDIYAQISQDISTIAGAVNEMNNAG